ncbi:bifunctional adenosylcobinamide kinase/adenosylcobinamide-phosphate guanylyltransferase [Sporosarcina thermotolerans]|uniref:Bifunctional adenosylcobinamide kinase/adenosylcobinamide-phosphate guanylyltransferase n=1 Tax=Sporosarcina thermotolerans TaxID=633404 RepID=A0AAW9A681_9BACL|nr:bifunctional adenosylcobinamide kinase/adenosylcobinamide-phosphate guanylyltransferase [Sporosarcina thermotolerans]MDW0116420.1 bifunctional adenosylcobinamide kinase/adenosylcobinamide-phosphate guanylyltransferase [Sporosarcina thermotolerans]
MHVIIGGAHNGKRDYVKKLMVGKEYYWLDFSVEDSPFDAIPNEPTRHTVVIEHIESWLTTTNLSEETSIQKIVEAVEGRDVIFILTDIGRGIVPMDALQRALRDACGRLYQQLIAQADEVTRIWYGLPQTLKKRGEIG